MDYFGEVERSVGRTRRGLIWPLLLTLGLGLGLIIPALPPRDGNWLMLAFGGFWLVLAAAICRYWWKLRDPRQAPLLRLLRERPHEIAWIYETRLTAKVYGATVRRTFWVAIRTIDRKMHMFSLNAGEPASFVAWVSRLAPRATVGYDKQREKAFRRDPQSFLRA